MNVAGGSSDGYLVPGLYDVLITATDTSGNSSNYLRTSSNGAFTLGAQAGAATWAWLSNTTCLGCSGGSLNPDYVYKSAETVILTARVVAYNQVISRVTYQGVGIPISGTFSKMNGTDSDQVIQAAFPIPSGTKAGTYVINLTAETANGRSSGSSISVKVG